MRRTKPIAAALAAGAVVAACSLGPAYRAPQVTTPVQWQAAPAGAEAWPSVDWFRSFGNAELERLVAQAIADNRDLRAAVIRIVEAEAQARIAGAALWPTLRGGSSASQSDRTTGVSHSFQGVMQAAYQVDLFGANRASASAAGVRVLSSQFDRETVAISLVADVTATFLQVLAARDRRRLAEETLGLSESILQLLEDQQRIGVVSDLEVAQQRSAVASQRASIPGLILAERQSLNALAVLLGRNPQGFDVATRSLEEVRLPAIAAGMPSALLQRRPDLRRAEADLQAANFDVAAARAARFPSIDLTAQGGSTSLALSGLFGPASFFYTLAASVSAPIFEGGRLEAQDDLARARFRELVESYQAAVLAAFRDVEDALNGSMQTRAQNDLQRQAYEQAREAFRLAETRYRVGTVNFLTVLDAQRSVFQTADSVVQSRLAQFTSVVNLYQALGGGWSGALPPPP
ncbi:MAG: efflux transporter outer membrane subunit [Rhodospirillales bacterium]